MEAVYLDFGRHGKGKQELSALSSSSSSFRAGNNGGILYTSPSSFYSHRRRHQQKSQPPLLPLPVFEPHQNNRRKINNTTNQQSVSIRKSNVSKHLVSCKSVIDRLGPEAMDVPTGLFNGGQVNKFSGSVVSTVLSPPPSSLPLPTFKLCCNTEPAAGIDAGATDNLRRILRLR